MESWNSVSVTNFIVQCMLTFKFITRNEVNVLGKFNKILWIQPFRGVATVIMRNQLINFLDSFISVRC